MAAPKIQTTQRVVPMIYAYTTPDIPKHLGWTKIGYTEQDVKTRIRQQTHTADIDFHEEWRGNATFEDGSGESFTDHDFHAYLAKLDVARKAGTEWFYISGPASHGHFITFRATRGILEALDAVVPYKLRREQSEAVERTARYAQSHPRGEFLWNAKPRFGKTLSVYDLCKTIQAQNVLIVTNRPAIANSWYSDYARFLGVQSGYRFVSEVDALKGKKFVLSREEYVSLVRKMGEGEAPRCIEFVSLQDLKGSIYFGGGFDKLREIRDMVWDVLVIDEAHEGVDTYKTDVAFNQIKREFTLHLSGTPFKALANDKFEQEAIFNWTYADEQAAKRNWDASGEEENPYANLPRLNLFTYQMSEIVKDELEQGIEIQGETEEYAFDLNEFFSTNAAGRFVHESSVDKFLDALTTQSKFPFSTPELRTELKHTFWLLNRVDSAKALAKKLEAHPVFGTYKVVLAAGDGRLDDAEEIQKSFDKVKAAIGQYDKTITLSVGQLTTGVTIPEWTAVLMLSGIRSPALYMQAAFRAQNPCLFSAGGQFFRKENAYVFDFDPARTLTIFEEFANDLSRDTADGRGDADIRKRHIRELLNFFPVIGEDEKGEMVELDAEKVLSIPRRIRSQEVVRRGFMSDFLFQNVSNVFHAPQAVLDIISSLTPVQEPKRDLGMDPGAAVELSINENGEVELAEDYVIGKSAEVFGEKIFGVSRDFEDTVADLLKRSAEKPRDETLENLKKQFQRETAAPILQTTQEKYTEGLKASDIKRLERKLHEDADRMVGAAYGELSIQRKMLEKERQEALAAAPAHRQEQVNREYDQRQREAVESFAQQLHELGQDYQQSAATEVVRTVETQKKEREKKGIEDAVKDHLRGFSRTIPSFLMAYGHEGVTLENFDAIIPGDVFLEVTSITLEQFRFLRDGGPYTDENGEEKHFEGKLFDPVVFNDSVKEFLRLRAKLVDYFDEGQTEDIFDYIPPQRTNQIFTPKRVVQQMVDLLEKEYPGCFDDPDRTFADLYMKSGLYIAEIVKRLYRSEEMKRRCPDGGERLRHIFARQVYGLAPTEIIYRIATNFILGFRDEIPIDVHNFRKLDALEYAKAGTLEQKLDEVFGGA